MRWIQTRRGPSATIFELAVFESKQANSIEKKALPTVYITPNYRDKISHHDDDDDDDDDLDIKLLIQVKLSIAHKQTYEMAFQNLPY